MIDRYIILVRSSKLKTAFFSLIFAAICFPFSFQRKEGVDLNYEILLCTISSLFMGVVWYCFSYGLVKVSDSIRERKAKEVQAKIDAKRRKADVHTKVNNKKKNKRKKNELSHK